MVCEHLLINTIRLALQSSVLRSFLECHPFLPTDQHFRRPITYTRWFSSGLPQLHASPPSGDLFRTRALELANSASDTPYISGGLLVIITIEQLHPSCISRETGVPHRRLVSSTPSARSISTAMSRTSGTTTEFPSS
jgi:hypothetical protein